MNTQRALQNEYPPERRIRTTMPASAPPPSAGRPPAAARHGAANPAGACNDFLVINQHPDLVGWKGTP
jgi:hypothetical protein